MTSSPIPSRGVPTVDQIERVLHDKIVRTSRLYSVRTGERKYGVGGHRAAAEAIAALFPVEAANGSGWRPIETAPKDGTWVDAWRPAPSFTGPRWEPRVTVQWNDDEAAWVWPDGDYEVFTVRGRELAEMKVIEEEYYADADRFTHWQPLASPPLAEGQDGKGGAE